MGIILSITRKCADPPGEVKPGVGIWVQIAKRLGIAEQYSPRLANIPDDKWDETIENLHREAYEIWALQKEIGAPEPAQLGGFPEETCIPLAGRRTILHL